MKTIFIFPLFFFFLSCKEKKETRLQPNSKDSITIATPKVDSVSTSNQNVGDKITNSKNTDCYDYLTELVRSSNFPFSEWDIPKEKINLIIDEHNNEFIRAKLAYDTNGTGTIGWIEYYLKTGILKNTSANLEVPEVLKYDKNLKTKFDTCIKNGNNEKSLQNKNLSLEKNYKSCKNIDLPISYSYEFISELPNFKEVPDDFKSIYQLEHLQGLKQINLKSNEIFKPVLITGYLDSGESEMYIVLLDDSYNFKDKILLYGSEEIEAGESISTTFEISKSFEIKINKSKINNSGKSKKISSIIHKINLDGTFSKIK
ncbi:hypothetical protein [Flavobacterium columnare]|uniref:Lipoprotein n=1 Tax=Flavobacterium columnare TaxID=996 RepID=A0AAJ3ZK53_9FLAO|nr:hypothetical protein [Flavobacterium columnare]AUX17246.1 hypothetical protein AQ623_02150 [Flavobacterium columnare]QCV57092.1 hypothetical protein UN65_14645 [Flavobacterium columnare]QOG56257.1 hypothetical protein HUE29_02100 [Flavobacterium columnare]QOG58980.1 hypothetical protein HUE30_02100 [Flavobacterium columnare]QOG61702.1 hypothetical protein HUE31_02105 [Flavobacterium columnare]